MKNPLLSESPIVFGIECVLIILLTIHFDLSIISIGGLMLIFGAKYMNLGNVFYSTIYYIGADLCWSINAFNSNDYFGAFTVNLGILVGLSVLYRMNKGSFVKSLRKIKGK